MASDEKRINIDEDDLIRLCYHVIDAAHPVVRYQPDLAAMQAEALEDCRHSARKALEILARYPPAELVLAIQEALTYGVALESTEPNE